MGGINLPTLGGIANLRPVHGEVSFSGASASYTNADYTCPPNTVAWVTGWSFIYAGGTGPALGRLRILDTAGAVAGTIVSAASLSVHISQPMVGSLMLLPREQLALNVINPVVGTLMIHTWAVIEFDYDEV